MKVLSITGDTMTLLYETSDSPAQVGDQFEVHQTSANAGLLVQVIANEMSEASHAADASRLPSESGARLMAITKIRKRIVENEWRSWDGWVPTGEVRVESIASSEVFRRLNITARCPLSVVSLDDGALPFDAGRLDMINACARRRQGHQQLPAGRSRQPAARRGRADRQNPLHLGSVRSEELIVPVCALL